MLNSSVLKRINEPPRKTGLLPMAGAGAGALGAALLALAPSPLMALAAVPVGAAGMLAVHKVSRGPEITTLDYENLGGEVAAHFASVREALEALSSSQKIWHLPSSTAPAPREVESILSSPERTPARVGLIEAPGIRANVPIWGIEVDNVTLFFFPEGALLYRAGRYDGISYKSLKVVFTLARFFEAEEVPGDAEVVEEARRRTQQRDGFYGRYGQTSRVPVVLYGLLEISSPHHKLEVLLQVSDLSAAAQFARTFGAGEPEKKVAYNKHKTKVASACEVLGVEEDASMPEISAAYRKMARKHHPDRVLELPAEVREFSEWRMKEINAAYSLLKRYG